MYVSLAPHDCDLSIICSASIFHWIVQSVCLNFIRAVLLIMSGFFLLQPEQVCAMCLVLATKPDQQVSSHVAKLFLLIHVVYCTGGNVGYWGVLPVWRRTTFHVPSRFKLSVTGCSATFTTASSLWYPWLCVWFPCFIQLCFSQCLG